MDLSYGSTINRHDPLTRPFFRIFVFDNRNVVTFTATLHVPYHSALPRLDHSR